jgi:hypothetical protein
MSGPRREIEPHNCPGIDDLDGGCYLGIPRRDRSSAVTIDSVSTESGAVHEVEAQKKDNRNKLRRAGAIETHLFVYVDPRNYLPWVSLVSGSPPIYPPQLPPEVTLVWAVTQTRTPGEYIVWRANQCSGWLAEAPTFIPETGDSA